MAGIDYDARIRRNRKQMVMLTTLAALNLWLLVVLLTAAGYVFMSLRAHVVPSPALIPVLGLGIGTPLTPVLLRRRLRSATPNTLIAIGAAPPPDELRLRLDHLAEGLAIARGIPPMHVAVIQDAAPNALAVGRDPATSVVAVTTGLIELLARDELEAVIAVEVCSIALHDIAVGTVAIACIGETTSLSNRWATNRDGSADWLGWIVCAPSRLIASALQTITMRDRATSADILAVETTRNPTALVRAMQKIQAHQGNVARWNAADCDLWFSSPAPWSYAPGAKGGHASLEERIAALGAAFGVSAPPRSAA